MDREKRKQFILECRKKRMTLQTIGNLLGLTHQRISQIISGYVSPATLKLIKPVEKLKTLVKRNREFLGLPIEIKREKFFGGLDFIREIVRQRDSHICQKCLNKWKEGQRRFDVHHLDEAIWGYKKRGICRYDRENLDKLITLCHSCHLGLHKIIRKQKSY